MTLLDEPNPRSAVRSLPTVWGHEPRSLHDRYWASRGVQVVRVGQQVAINHKAELFLLLDSANAVLFDLQNWIELLNWTKPDLLFLRCHAKKNLGYREVLSSGENGEFLRFERRYRARKTLSVRVALTCDSEFADAWQNASSSSEGWRQLRAAVPRAYREVRSSPARIYQLTEKKEIGRFAEDLVGIWNSPGSTIARVKKTATSAWVDPLANVDAGARIVGTVWVGAGRQLVSTDVVVGPAVLWDESSHRPATEELSWADIEPSVLGSMPRSQQPPSSIYRWSKRLFDIAFSIVGIVLTLPLYPFIMLSIWMEDGGPIFFGHERETIDGRSFRCLKFRSMRKDADKMAPALALQNQADGPQFFIDKDPRVTRVGRLLRKTHLDELPQFFNVLLGAMSVVGPRPSPHSENQYCPEWRDTRLSVRPGITGLWQVRRTRLRGRDFQEWIRYDIQYVENMSWSQDIKLLWQTVVVVCRRAVRS